eukprot:6194923-Pleurochrysis_carterae.AAC.1
MSPTLQIDTTAVGNGRAAWAILQGNGQSPRTGLTNIDDDSKWSSLRLSDVGIGERTITKIVAKINQINLESESTRQFNENERCLKFLSMIIYPAHLAIPKRRKNFNAHPTRTATSLRFR